MQADLLSPAEFGEMLDDPEFAALPFETRRSYVEKGIGEASRFITKRDGGWTPERWQDFGAAAAQARQFVADSETTGETLQRYAGVAGQTIKDLPAIIGTGALGLSPVIPDGKGGVTGQVPGETLGPALGRNLVALATSGAAMFSDSERPLVQQLGTLKEQIDQGTFLTHKEGFGGWIEEQNAAVRSTQQAFYENEGWAEQNSLLGSGENVKLMQEYLVTRSPQSWEALQDNLLRTPLRARLQGDKQALENDTKLGQALAPEARALISEAADPAELLPGMLAVKKGAQVLSRGASKASRALDAAKGVAGEMLGEQVSATINDPYLTAAERLQIAKDSLAGTLGLMGVGAGVQAAANRFTRPDRAVEAEFGAQSQFETRRLDNVPPGAELTYDAEGRMTGWRMPAQGQQRIDNDNLPPNQTPAQAGPPLPRDPAEVNPPGMLAQVAARAGRYETPLSEAAPTALPDLQTDLDSMPETGAELVYDEDGSPLGWVPLPPSPNLSASESGVLTPGNDPVTAALATLDAARPEGPAALSPPPPVNQPDAAANAAPQATSASAPIAGSPSPSIPAPARQPADGIRVASGGNVLTAPLAPAAPLAPVPAGTSAASAPTALPETAPPANRGSAALPVPPGGTTANASQPPTRDGAGNPGRGDATLDTIKAAPHDPLYEYQTPGEDSPARRSAAAGIFRRALTAVQDRLGQRLEAIEWRDQTPAQGARQAGAPTVRVVPLTNGKIKLQIDQGFDRSLWEDSKYDLRRFAARLEAALFEETIHVTQLEVMRQRWHAAGRPGTFRGFYKQQFSSMLSQARSAASRGTPRDLQRLQQALHASWISYFDSTYTGTAQQLWQDMNRPPFFDEQMKINEGRNEMRFVMEFTRQVIQMQRMGYVTETATSGVFAVLKRWVSRLVTALKQAHVRIAGGRWGDQLRDFVHETEALLDGDVYAEPFIPEGIDHETGDVFDAKPVNPFHSRDFSRLPNWLKSRLRIPANAPFRVQNLGLRSILRGSSLPADLLPFAQQSQRDIAAVQQTAAQLGNDLNLAIDAYAKRTATTLEAAHKLVATAMENPAVLAALGDPVLKERTRRARNFLDDLSQAVAQHTGGELGKAILQNRGHWMRRAYAAFDPAANWNYDNLEKAAAKGEKINGVDAKKILDEARKHIETALNAQRAANAQRKGLRPGTPTAPATVKEVEAVMRQLTDRNTWERNLLGNMGGSGISKETTSLMRRADYHPDVKKWLKQTGLNEWDYTTVASLAATGGSYQGRPAAALLQAARSHLAARHPKAGKAEINDMLRLKDIPPAIRALMGEEVNPLKRFLNSASFQAQFIARHEQQKAMRDIGLQMGLFSTKQEAVFTEVVGDSRERDGFKIEVQAQTPGGQTVTVPRPIYATPETAAALRTATGVSSNPAELGGALVNALRFIGSEAKLNKVALNPDSWFVNGIGNFMGLVQSGDLLSLSGWRNVARAIELHRSGQAKASDVLNAAQEAERDARRQMLARLTAAGVANSGLELSDIEAGLDNRVTQFINAHDSWNTAAGGMRGAILGNGIGRPFGWIGQAIGATAGAIAGTKIGGQRIQAAQKKIAEWTTGNPDRIAKLSSFYGNYEAHLAAGMAELTAFELAAEKTINTMPDYSQLPALMRELSRLGLMGSFIGFQYEVYRNAFHNARYGIAELRSGNAALAVRGARRLIGLSSMLTLAGFGLQSLIRGIFDSGVDDEEDEAYRRALGAEHERFGNLAYTKLDSDGASFFNTSYLLPQVTLFEVIKAGMEGRDFGESLSNIGKQLTDQFVSGSVHLDPLIAAWTNQRPVGGKVSNEQGARNLAERVAYFLYVTAEPGALNKEDRIVRAIEGRGRYGRQFSLDEELKRFLGIRQNTYLHEERIKSRLFRFRDAYDDARSLARTAYRQGDPGAPAALERANVRIQEIQADWDQFTNDLETIGVSANKLEQIRKATGVAKTFAPLIMGENGPESERARTLKAYRSDLPDAERDAAPKMMFGKR